MLHHYDFPFTLSDKERQALVDILAGNPYLRIPFMNSQRNRLIANGMTRVVWASELRLIADGCPAAMATLLDASSPRME